MKTIKKKLKLTEEEYYIKHLSIINNFLPVKLKPKEVEVLANFMMLKGDIANDRFGTTARKIIMRKMNLSIAGVSNYLKSLRSKGFIIGDEVLPILFPEEEKQSYIFEITNE